MKTIRGSLGSGGRVGWFAFQDIIMSVTGILIVIALILALQIDRVWDPSRPSGLSDDTDPAGADGSTLAVLLDEVAGLREELELIRAGRRAKGNRDELAAEVSRLEDAVGRARASLTVSVTPQDGEELAAADLARIAEIARLDHELKQVEAEYEKTRQEAGELPSIPDLERRVRESEALVAQSRQGAKKMRLIPEKSDTTKEPLVLVVGAEELKLMRFDAPEVRSFRGLHDFTLSLKRYRKVDQYFVIFVRPSGVVRFDDVLQAIKNAGFEVGYDALGEDTEILLGKGGDS
jgi:hypothetical protein